MFFNIMNVIKKIFTRFVHYNKTHYSITQKIEINLLNIMILRKVGKGK